MASNDNDDSGAGLDTRISAALLEARIAVGCVAAGLQMMERRQMSEPLHSEMGVLARFAGEAAEAFEKLATACDERFTVHKLQ